MVGSTLVFARVQSSLPVAKSNAVRLLPPPYTLPSSGAARTVFSDGESYHRITFPVEPSTRTRFSCVLVGPANVPAISKSPVPPYASMSHTSAPVLPRFGAMGLYLLVCESRTARLPTLARTVPSRLLTWEMRPPSQTLVPTCSMALTSPSTIGVLSGFSDGNASTAPLARRRAAAVENSNMRVLLIPIISGSARANINPACRILVVIAFPSTRREFFVLADHPTDSKGMRLPALLYTASPALTFTKLPRTPS